MPKTFRQERLDDKAIADVGGVGEVNTGANVGIDGVGVFDGKSSVQLQFRNVAPASSKVTTTLNGADIDIDVVEANVDHDNIANAADASHVHIGTSAPAEVGGFWIDTTGGTGAYKVKFHNGTAWVEFAEG